MTEPLPTAVPIRPRIVPRRVAVSSRRAAAGASPGAARQPAGPDEVPTSLPEGEPDAPPVGLRREELRRGTRRLTDLLDLGDLLGLGALVAAAIIVLNFVGPATGDAPAQAGSGAIQAATAEGH